MSRIAFLSVALLTCLLWPSGADARGSENTWVRATALAPSCTLDVVLVTFQDETETTAGEDCHYCNHDRPYGTNSGESADSSYTLRDFERLFSGGYGNLAPLVGDTVTVASHTTLPEVYGSVRAYYDSMSLDPRDRAQGVRSGKFQLHVRLINAENGDYPRWIELPRTKAHYARIDWNDPRRGDLFWDEAYAAAWDSVRCWNPNEIPNVEDPPDCGDSVSGYTIADIPNNGYSLDRRVRHKVVYLYSGAAFTDREPPGLLHPQVDQITATNPMDSTQVGYRYVTGERVGLGGTNHSLDRFGSIGFHVHEIGHLLGLNHGDGRWEGENPHMPRSTRLDTNAAGANFVGWSIMQGGAEGPVVAGAGYYKGYGSCPVPINPFYRMDLGWLTPTVINKSKEDYLLALGGVHQIDTGTHNFTSNMETAERDTLLLERRSNNGFGRYVSFYEFEDQDPGLLIWRRNRMERPVLIVADGRRIRDAREQEQDEENDPIQIHEYQDQLSDPFPVPANVYTSHGQHDSYAQPAVNAVYAHTDSTGLRQETGSTSAHRDPGNLGLALTDIRRRTGSDNDSLTLDIHLNYWAGDIVGRRGEVAPARETWGDGHPDWDTDTRSM